MTTQSPIIDRTDPTPQNNPRRILNPSSNPSRVEGNDVQFPNPDNMMPMNMPAGGEAEATANFATTRGQVASVHPPAEASRVTTAFADHQGGRAPQRHFNTLSNSSDAKSRYRKEPISSDNQNKCLEEKHPKDLISIQKKLAQQAEALYMYAAETDISKKKSSKARDLGKAVEDTETGGAIPEGHMRMRLYSNVDEREEEGYSTPPPTRYANIHKEQ